jgi:hypothetical protein
MAFIYRAAGLVLAMRTTKRDVRATKMNEAHHGASRWVQRTMLKVAP